MKRSVFAASVAFCLIGFQAAAQESLRGVERKIQEAWEGVGTLVAKVRMESWLTLGTEQVAAQGEGTLEYMQAVPQPKYRQKITIQVPPPAAMEASFEFLFDGEALFLINEIMGQTMIAKAETADFSKGALPPGGRDLLEALRAELDLNLQPDAELDGRKVFVIEGKRPKKRADDPVHRALIYIDKESGIQRRAEFFTEDGKLNSRIDFSDFRINIPVDSARFVYDGPLPPEESQESGEDTPAPPVQVP